MLKFIFSIGPRALNIEHCLMERLSSLPDPPKLGTFDLRDIFLFIEMKQAIFQ